MSNFIQVPASLVFFAISEFWFSGFSGEAFLIGINNKKLDQIISKMLMLTKYSFCILIGTFCFAHVKHFWTCFEDIVINNNDKLLIIFQQVDVYLNKQIKIDELIKLANQSIQRRTRDRNSRHNKKCCFWKQKISWLLKA